MKGGIRESYPFSDDYAQISEQSNKLSRVNAMRSLPMCPCPTIVMREKEAWRTTKGTWAKAYCFVDAHSEVAVTVDGNFQNWERERAQRDDRPPAAAAE
jgi:hypothetical protein